MKKFFTLIAAAMMAVCANASVAITNAFNSWGDGCTVDGNKISFTAAWKGAGCWLATGDAKAGTYAGYDMSAYDYIWVTFAKGGTATLNMVIQYGSECVAGASGTSSASADAGAFIVGAALDEAQKADVSQFFLQSKAAGDIEITGAYVGTKAEYEAAVKEATDIYKAPVALEFDEWGQVLASAFNGYSDDAKVEFTFEVTGATGYVGWGAGTIKSLDGAVEFGGTGSNSIQIKNEGENVMTMTLSQIKDILNAGPSEYGQYGVCFNVWGFGSGACTVTRKSLTISELKDFDGEGYKDPTTSGIEAVEAAPAAQKVVKTSNGIIKNGVKYNFAGQRVK